jgi:hypothetical protein
MSKMRNAYKILVKNSAWKVPQVDNIKKYFREAERKFVNMI